MVGGASSGWARCKAQSSMKNVTSPIGNSNQMPGVSLSAASGGLT